MRYRAEILQNGLLSVYDYVCQWYLTYHKNAKGKWEAHNTNAQIHAYTELLDKLNREFTTP